MERRTVALFLRSLDNDYQQRLREDAVASGDRQGFAVDVFSANNDPARQSEEMLQLIAGPDAAKKAAILVSPVHDESLASVARAAGRAGIGWGLLNREAAYLDSMRNDFPALPIFSVTPDQAEIGRLQGQQAKALLPPGGGGLLYVMGPAATWSARRRLDGLKEELAATPTPLTVLEANWTSESARLAVERWVEGLGDGGIMPVVVCAQNDDMALGVRQALRDAASRRGQPELALVPITGCDGSPGLGQRLVREKRLSATVAVPSASGPAIEWLARARDDGARPPIHIMLPVSSFPEVATLRH
jgi:ABC-type sugar transport system substrate-binding protein